MQPQVAGYWSGCARVAALGLRSPLFLMTSGGAIAISRRASPSRCARRVRPAGGAVLSRRVAEQSGIARALSFDMGGTTAKICFIDDYQPQITRSFEFGRVHRHLKGSGLPIRIPVIEMVEIGAGAVRWRASMRSAGCRWARTAPARIPARPAMARAAPSRP